MAFAALGVAASATQLAAYGLTIISYIATVYERVQNAPQEYHEYKVQLQNLVNTAQRIEHNPALQTPDVQSHLDAISVEVRALQSMLCPAVDLGKNVGKKNWNIIINSEQRKITMHLKRLYQMDIALLLCISTINTGQLSDMKGSINKFADLNIELGQKTPETGATKGALRPMGVEGVAERLPLACVQGNPTQSAGQAQMQTDPTAVGQQKYWNTYGIIRIGKKSKVTNGDTFSKLPLQYPAIGPAISRGSLYCNVVIGGECEVHNGVTGAPPTDAKGGSVFEMIEIDESSKVHNGNFDSVAVKKEAIDE